jgi:hypothetical protein
VFSLLPLVIPFLDARGKLPRSYSALVKTAGEKRLRAALIQRKCFFASRYVGLFTGDS